MRISVAADERTGVAEAVVDDLRRRGHETIVHGALADGERDDWAWASEAAARDVAEGRADQGIVACWTGTGASIAANKVAGVRAALCCDPQTAEGARRWNDANVLALSLRTTSEALLGEILDAWFAGEPSRDEGDTANIRHVEEIGSGESPELAAIRRGWDAYGRGDLEAVLDAFDPDIVWETDEVPGMDDVYRGHEGVRRFWVEWLGEWDDYQSRLLDMRWSGDEVITRGWQTGRGRSSGLKVEMNFVMTFRFRNGKVVRARLRIEPATEPGRP